MKGIAAFYVGNTPWAAVLLREPAKQRNLFYSKGGYRGCYVIVGEKISFSFVAIT
jgi:hypothetical protein